MNVEQVTERKLAGKTKELRENPPPNRFVCQKSRLTPPGPEARKLQSQQPTI
jgi:hypothetical protein